MKKLFCVSVPNTNVTMKNISSNSTTEAESQIPAFLGASTVVFLSLNDILLFLIGQPLIIRLLWVTFKSRKTVDILNFNLALINLLHYWISFGHLHFLLLKNRFHHQILKFLCSYGMIGGPSSLLFICLERYIAVVYPMYFQLLRTYRFREVSAALVWCLTLPLSSVYTANGKYQESYNERILDFPAFLLVAISVMMMHCSIRIAYLLKQPGPGRAKIHPAKKKAFKTVCTNILVIVTCYSPVAVLQRMSFPVGAARSKVLPVCVFMLSVASVVHPLLYLSGQGKLCVCCKGDKKGKWFIFFIFYFSF